MIACSFIDDDFLAASRIVKQLGSGVHGSVFLVERSNGEQYAVKYAKAIVSGLNQNVLSDIDTAVRFRGSPHIIQLVGIRYDSSPVHPNIAMIMEAMDSNLKDFSSTTAPETRLRLAPELLTSLLRALSLRGKLSRSL